MRKQLIRPTIAGLILVVTTWLFIRYFQSHPHYLHLLRTVSPWVIVWILVLNLLMTFVLTTINVVSLMLCGARLSWSEMFILTSYSSVANFFGPLQSGPGVRALYLKTKYGVRLRDYTLATLVTLAIFALWNVIFLCIGGLVWWQSIAALSIVLGGSIGVYNYYRKRDTATKPSQFRLNPTVLTTIVVLTFIQVCIIAAWYFIELRAVDHTILLRQAVSYSGAANFSLFVSITPDAIGIREVFLLFSRHLHHVSTATIVSANIIDRAAYVIYLLLLFVATLGMHARQKFAFIKHRQSGAVIASPKQK